MAQETSRRNHEQEMVDDITRIFNELIGLAKGTREPIQAIPVKFISNNSWRTWDVIARLGNYTSTYRIPQRTCGYVTVEDAIHKFRESRGDIDISNFNASQEGECWMFDIKIYNESQTKSA